MKKAVKRMMQSESSYMKAKRRIRIRFRANKDLIEGLEFFDEETKSDRKYLDYLSRISEDVCYG